MVILFSSVLLTGCYSFIGSDGGPPFYSGDETHYFEKLVHNSLHQNNRDFTYQLAEDGHLRVVDADPQVKHDVLQLPLLLRFVWFSDVQLRQREIKLFSRRASQALADVIPSFERHFVQEDFDWAVYLAHIKAVNILNEDHPLDFMIHTGDAIDAGTIEELYQFIHISDQLRIPWLNVVGNHDVSIFGNYKERLGYTRQAGVTFFPVGNLANFVWMHRGERAISGFGHHLLPVPSEGGHSPSESYYPDKKLPATFHHGFDYEPGQRCGAKERREVQYDSVPGYYAVDLCGTAVPMRLLALNSARLEDWGADGEITPEQREWIKRTLQPAAGGVNLVFVHHRPGDFDPETQGLLAGPGHDPIVMFTGHTHKHHLAFHRGEGSSGYYELNTGSVLDFPQIGRLIELRGDPSGQIWLVSRALWNTAMASFPALPQETGLDKTLADCRNQRKAKREDLVEAAQCGHYGAYADYRQGQRRAWGRPQPFAEAWKEVNVILPVVP